VATKRPTEAMYKYALDTIKRQRTEIVQEQMARITLSNQLAQLNKEHRDLTDDLHAESNIQLSLRRELAAVTTQREVLIAALAAILNRTHQQ
jgi:hypothetical protein